ncbi:MAG TPA: prenyltransferase/squalene oxidase repeat-containing protein [Pirellulales bacterium]|nr:prenyltransferase/squalene oxidase repeat-containing protein [Pirellulales bacterium]
MPHRYSVKHGASLKLPAARLLLVALAAAAVPASLSAADPEAAAAELITPAAQKAIDQGLAFLARRQNDDGSFASSDYGRNAAVCGLAGLAFMSSGSTPGRGPYGAHVSRSVDFILDHAQESGFIDVPGASSHGPMYGHGFATLFLAEAYGMSPRRDVREKLAKAVELIVNTQNDEGGWRYQPLRQDADISVTVCEVMALRAARNAGLFVPKATIDKAIDYVKRSQNADGGFMYMLQTGGESDFPRSAAGVVALYSAGIYEGPEIEKGLAYLRDYVPGNGSYPREVRYYFYSHYYAVQAMWHAGGDSWRRWYPAIRDELCSRQQPGGAWSDSICQEYGTAMACLILQMPNNYLPIFQR